MSTNRATSARADNTTHERELFTLERAQRAIPLLQRIVADVVAQFWDLLHVQKRYQKLLVDGPSDALESIRDDRQRIASRLTELATEIEQVGCELKDYETGQVDFPAVFHGREVVFCWKLGEDRITAWREPFEGYGSRQPLEETPPVA
jgi:hypothetical protein